ncbi:MAG: aminotransferase class IV [Leptolyngbya sp.]|nr:aminotransferase class IV [Leptolyngbya sp.]
MVYWFDGQPREGDTLSLAANEPAFLYGATAFTTLRVYQHSLDHPLTHWNDHLQRLRHTLETFQWTAPNWNRVRRGADWLQPSFPVLRITCFPDGRELIAGRPLPADLSQKQGQGITAWLATPETYRRALPNHKTGNYLGSWLALQQAQRRGAAEAILIDGAGHWLETSTGSLWGWGQGQWWTPPLASGLLPGIARQHVIDHLQHQGIAVGQDPWGPEVIHRLDSLAYSNAVVEIVPIHTVITDHSKLVFNAKAASLKGLRAAFEAIDPEI